MGGGDAQQLMTVQATKVLPETSGSAQRLLSYKLVIAENMEQDDKQLSTARVASLAATANAPIETAYGWAEQLPKIYSILAPMGSVLPVPLIAQLAGNMAPTWIDSEAQRNALNEGLGMKTPQPEFWKPLGELTSGLSSDDKVWLLADLVPLFGGSAEVDAALQQVPSLLEDVQAIVRETVPEFALVTEEIEGESAEKRDRKAADQLEDVQLLAADLVVVDYLSHRRAELREPFLAWVRSRDAAFLTETLEARKDYKTSTSADGIAAFADDADSAEYKRVEDMLNVIVGNQARYRRDLIEQYRNDANDGSDDDTPSGGGDVSESQTPSRDYSETRGPVRL